LPGPVRCCYEAGPTGFGLYRAAVAAGIDCQVIAPSKTPRPSGDRNKSDRRDTDLLLRQLMAGGLTAVVVFVGDVRGRSGSGAGARAGQSRSDALPAPALEACRSSSLL
jgi:transposase